MSTVFNRVYAHCKTNKLPMPETEEIMEIGKKVSRYWQSKDRKQRFIKVDATEHDNGGGFKVIYYPKEFTPEIDNVVASHFANVLKPELCH